MYLRLTLLAAALPLWLSATVFLYGRWRDTAEALDAAQARIHDYEEAARIHRNYVLQLREQIAAFDEVERELEQLEGRDALLSDHLRRAAGKLWP